jgi:hypothetical protein
MKETRVTAKDSETRTQDPSPAGESRAKLDWETPRMEEVSEQVTAQPYIRFT